MVSYCGVSSVELFFFHPGNSVRKKGGYAADVDQSTRFKSLSSFTTTHVKKSPQITSKHL